MGKIQSRLKTKSLYIYISLILLFMPSCEVDMKNIVSIRISNNDFCSIRKTIESLKETSDSTFYNIIIPNGTYYEIDIRSNENITLIGEHRDSVIIICNGDTTLSPPENYTYDWGNAPINQMDQTKIHCFWVTTNFYAKNLTIVTKRGKYCVHQDGPGEYISTFENCKFIGNNLVNCIGIGSRCGQLQKYIDCDFDFQGYAIGWHNYNNQSCGSGLEVRNCNFSNDYLWLNELGSTQNDSIYLINCKSNSLGSILLRSLPGYYINIRNEIENDPLNIPYSIQVVIENTSVNILTENRPNSTFLNN